MGESSLVIIAQSEEWPFLKWKGFFSPKLGE